MSNDSITHIGAMFLVYLFIVIISYYLISTPAEALFDAFDDVDFGLAEDEKDSFLPLIRSCFTICMAIILGIPVTWLVFKVFSRDPDYYYYRRY